MCARGTGGDDVADLDIAVRNNDPVNEEFNQLAALRKGCLCQASLDLLAESLNGCHDLRDRLVVVHLRLQLLPLPFQGVETFIQCLPPVTIFRQRHGPRLIGIAHTLNLTSKMLHPALQLGAPGL